MFTGFGRLFSGIGEELRSPVAPFPVDHIRTRMVALFLYVANALLLLYETMPHRGSVWTVSLTVLCLVLSGALTASEYVTTRLRIAYAAWVRPLFFLQFALIGPLRYLGDASALNECLMLAGILIYFIRGVDIRVSTVDVLVGSVVAYGVSVLLGFGVDGLAFLFLVATSALAGILVLAKELYLRRARMKTIRNLVGVMAHELRTPLATISLCADNIERGLGSGAAAEQGHASMARLRASVRYLHAIIDLQIANSSAASRRGEAQLFDLGDLVRFVHEDYPYRRPEERESVDLDLQDRVMFRGSETLMRQVITNLLKNSIAAVARTNRPFAKGDITLRVSEDGTDVVVVVADKGVGIDPREQSRIFEPFFSATPKATSGLGLAQVREAVNFMGGSLRLASEPGKGTTFTFRVPAEII